MKLATVVRRNLPDYLGVAHHIRVVPPIKASSLWTQNIVVSAAQIGSDQRPEVMAFPADGSGQVTSLCEVFGARDTFDWKELLEDNGYTIKEDSHANHS